MRTVVEGFKSEHTPDMKYYAFDWDDNIVHMPTKIMLKTEDGDEIGMSTDDFAQYRHDIGKKTINYKGETIVDYSDDAFRNFKTNGDKDFLIDAMTAEKGPAFNDFKEGYLIDGFPSVGFSSAIATESMIYTSQFELAVQG